MQRHKFSQISSFTVPADPNIFLDLGIINVVSRCVTSDDLSIPRKHPQISTSGGWLGWVGLDGIDMCINKYFENRTRPVGLTEKTGNQTSIRVGHYFKLFLIRAGRKPKFQPLTPLTEQSVTDFAIFPG